MEFLQTIVLAVVQGITEFLPISSSGHLVLVPLLTSWSDQGVLFDIALHVGTLLAVMLYFWRQTFTLTQGSLALCVGKWRSDNAQLVLKLAITTVPIILFALLVKDFVATGARSFIVLGLTSIIFAIVLWWADEKAGLLGPRQLGALLARFWPAWLFPKVYRRVAESLLAAARAAGPRPQPKTDIAELTYREAIIFGVFQALAVIPGTSRSGICMAAGRLLGFSRAGASRVAMLMAIPTIALAGLFALLTDLETGLNWHTEGRDFLIGMVLSFITALAAIHLLLKLVDRIGFLPFVVYRVMLGTMLLVIAILMSMN